MYIRKVSSVDINSYTRSLTAVNILGSQKCALLLDVP
jgi:hypothetical protein